MAKVAVYIGRFQPFHSGHAHVLSSALWNYDIVVVLIGSAFQSRTIKNPFTFGERKEMIELWKMGSGIDGGKLVVLPLRDQPYNNAKWLQSVQETVQNTLALVPGEHEISITGAEQADTDYLNSFPQFKKDLVQMAPGNVNLHSTSLRYRLFKDVPVTISGRKQLLGWDDVPNSTLNFLEGFRESESFRKLKDEHDFMEKYRSAWASAPYAPSFLTVDNVVIQSGHVLVVERGALPGKGLWALPGGFVNPTERLMQAALRELVEETGIKIPVQILEGSIKAKEIFDDPNRSLRGRTVTTAFLIRLDDTKPLPKVKGQNAPLHETGGKKVVETAKAFWLPINDARARSECWFEDHHAILDTMVGMIKD